MRYVKDNVITSNPNFKNVVNPSYEFILANGWKVYVEPEPTTYQLACEKWGNMAFAKKVIADFDLQFEYPQVISYAIINPDLMAIEKKADGIHVYYNELHDNHLPLVQGLGLTEFNRPNPADYA